MADDKAFQEYLNSLDNSISSSSAVETPPEPPPTNFGDEAHDAIMGGVHAGLAPLGVPKGLTDIAASNILGVINPSGGPAGSRGAQIAEQNKAQGFGDSLGDAGNVLRNAVPFTEKRPVPSAGGGGRLLGEALRRDTGGLPFHIPFKILDELTGALTKEATEYQKRGQPDKARYLLAARDAAVNGEATLEDLATDPLLVTGSVGSILKKVGGIAGRYGHLVGTPGLVASAADAGGKVAGGLWGATDGGDPREAVQGATELAPALAMLKQGGGIKGLKDWKGNPTGAPPPANTLDARVETLTNPKVSPEEALSWNSRLEKIPIVGHGRLTKGVGAYTSSGRVQSLLGKESVDPIATKMVVDAINELSDPSGQVDSKTLVGKLKEEGSPLTGVDVQNTLAALQSAGFLRPISAGPGKQKGEGSLLITDHGEWGYLTDKIGQSPTTVEHPADYFRKTGKPLPTQLPPPPSAPKAGPTRPVPLSPLDKPLPPRKAARIKKASQGEFANRNRAVEQAGEVPLNSPLRAADEPLSLDAPPPLTPDTPGTPPLEAPNEPFIPDNPFQKQGPPVEPTPPVPNELPVFPGMPGVPKNGPPPAPALPVTQPPPPGAPGSAPPPETPPLPPPPVQASGAPPVPPATESLLNKGRALIQGGNPPLPVPPVSPPAEQAPSPGQAGAMESGPPIPAKKLSASRQWIADNADIVGELSKLDRAAAAKHPALKDLSPSMRTAVLKQIFAGRDSLPPPPEGSGSGPKADSSIKSGAITKKGLLPPPGKTALHPKYLSNEEIHQDLTPDYGTGKRGVWKREQFSEDEIDSGVPKKHKLFAWNPEGEGSWVSGPKKISRLQSPWDMPIEDPASHLMMALEPELSARFDYVRSNDLINRGEVPISPPAEASKKFVDSRSKDPLDPEFVATLFSKLTPAAADEALAANKKFGYQRFAVVDVPTRVRLYLKGDTYGYVPNLDEATVKNPEYKGEVTISLPRLIDLFAPAIETEAPIPPPE